MNNDDAGRENHAGAQGAMPSPAAEASGVAPCSGTGHVVKHSARRQFESWAHTYDQSVVQHLLFQPAYRLLMEELYRWRRDNPEPIDLLDIGSGTGSWADMVLRAGLPLRRVIGLDYAPNMCRVALGKFRSVTGASPRFINGDAEHIPFGDGSFDAVTCSHSFHHYPHQAATVREMHRVLRPGGRLMLVDGFRDNTIGWVLYDVFIARGEGTSEATVFHAPWSMMRRYFEEAGFNDVQQRKENIWAPLLFTMGVA